MTNKLLDYAILGVAIFIWTSLDMWASGAGYWMTAWTMLTTVLVFLITYGKTSGDHAIAHFLSAVNGSLNMLIGFVVMHITFDIFWGFSAGYDLQNTMMMTVGLIVTMYTSMLMAAAVNSIRS